MGERDRYRQGSHGGRLEHSVPHGVEAGDSIVRERVSEVSDGRDAGERRGLGDSIGA